MSGPPDRPMVSARRIGGANAAASATSAAPAAGGLSGQAWLLRIFAFLFIWPLAIRLMGFNGPAALALVIGIVLLFAGSELVKRGLAAEAALRGRTLAQAPKIPQKFLGSVSAGLGAAAIAMGAVPGGAILAIIQGGLVYFGCRLAYGSDAKTDRDALAKAAKSAGLAPADVLSTLDEAYAKVKQVEAMAGQVHSRELVARLQRITAQARGVLAQIERDPRDISRARRFLVTYLDGTRDVVTKYVAQQKDVADTPLGDSFRKLLDTIEQVFVEQEQVLKSDDKLDLEVQLEVLETQLRREGIH